VHGETIEGYSLLVLSLLVLAVGPALHQLARATGTLLAALDGFVYVTMGGMVLFHILPETYHLSGWPVFIALALGLLGPGWVEHRLEDLAPQAHTVASLLALVGIGLHGFTDGLALGQGGHEQADEYMLPWAVILHRLPVGLMVWFLLRPVYGVRLALATLLLIGVFTIMGFELGEIAVGELAIDGLGLFQAFVSGTLLHVVVHRSYPIDEVGASPAARRRQSGFGAVGGLVLLVFIVTDHLDPAIVDSSQAFMRLAWESAPALLLAYLAAGLVYGFMPKGSLAWMSRGGNLSQSLRGMGFGLPLPICSCGVVPVYRSLVSKGVPVSAALSFLVATPELSIDAVLISLPLLGGEFTLVRVACAAAVALLVGWGVGRWVVPHVTTQQEVLSEEPPMRAQSRLVHSLKTGLVDVVDDTAPWIMLGLGVAALADALLLTNALNSIPDWSEVALFALLGIPTYVCASGATPLAAVLVYKGVSPGASLAFLLTGPATNLTTFGVLARLHGRRLAMVFATAIMVLSILLGWGVNVVSPVVEAPVLNLGFALQWRSWEGLCFLALCALFLASFVRMGPRAFVSEIASDGEADHDHHYGEDACCAAETACASDHAHFNHND
tara:strand:- start:2207 stop:4045 length:1839 start_codon:yes stop_codon:yes gene_type:complete